MGTIQFDFPLAGTIGLPLVSVGLLLVWWGHRRRGRPKSRIAALTGLRTVTMLGLVFMVARPVWVQKAEALKTTKTVVLLVDRSESMSLAEGPRTRYQAAVAFARDHLLPALKESGLLVQPWLFAQDGETVDGPQMVAATPNGKRTNLGGAIARGLAGASGTPLAVIALTDGAANEKADNTRALSALAETRVPFIGVGFGSDRGGRTLSLCQVEGPAVAAPNSDFNVTAHLEAANVEELPGFELVLLRDGKFLQQKTVPAGKGSRFWLESFRIKETEPGAHRYEIQLLPPQVSGLVSGSTTGSASVRITKEKELRVLYVQGALTWDYKFIVQALRGDPSIKLTGLARTSAKSVFRQNVETTGELLNGFPTTLEEIAPFRVVVLSNLKPSELTSAQQELLARFCGELAGGVLMIGGAGTFDASWHGSRLEQLLPVLFAANTGVQGLDQPFQFQLTDEALHHPVFQISEGRAAQEVWNKLPTFTQYGRVESAKPGAQIWARHPTDEGPQGRRILMASQRYGAGLSAILTVQNFWRWRLAKESDPQQFDRFWRQFFRFLSESSRPEVAIQLADQELRPQMDVRVILEKQSSPTDVAATGFKFLVRVDDDQKQTVQEQQLDLPPARPVELTFRAERAGLYTVSVLDAQKQPVSARAIEIREVNVELQNTARNMENLQQWAGLSDGLAVKVEDCPDGRDLVSQIKSKVELARRTKVVRVPLGLNAWVLTLLLGCLGGEWLLRKHWGLV